ncbi:uncharacterized protein DDB_G0271670-like [Musca domestica]|uniref:Uncharacterized protein DDB_G0271670-like n=1 Tax=Musca domestica TaxID=7370 RepID=A0ABM3V246_MUSDO|nr:uncharacterized protein DDB_G0271670-like [Musca domestica]XP_058979873.1 uncharacterized protein DDB_G0271670-like [Musca domestica]
MEQDSPNTKKFKRAKEKFRAHLEQVEAQRRRTIFLDEGPSTSRKRRTNQYRKPNPRKGSSQSSSPQHQIFYRMCSTTPNDVPQQKCNTTENNSDDIDETDSLNEETQPSSDVPRTPTYAPCFGSPNSFKPASDVLSTPTSRCSEMPVTPGKEWCRDSDDASTLPRPNMEESGESQSNFEMDEECRRMFYGYLETSVTRRAQSPLSSNNSSLDESDNEDQRSSSPPKRYGLGFVRQKDSQYKYLGFRCYERTVTVQLLVPDSGENPIYEITNPPPDNHRTPSPTPAIGEEINTEDIHSISNTSHKHEEVPTSSSHAFAHLEEDSRSTASSFVTVSEDPSSEWWTQWQTLVGVPPSSPLYNITEQANLLHSDDVQIPSQSNAAVISDDHRSPNVKEDKSLPGTPGHVVELSSPSMSSRSSSSSSSASSSLSSSSSSSASSSSSSSTSQTMTPHQPTLCSSQPSIDEVFIPSKENNSTPSTIKLPVTEIPTESTPSSSTDNPVNDNTFLELPNYPENLQIRIEKFKNNWKKGHKLKRIVKQDGKQYRIIISADGVVKVSLRISAIGL